MAIHFRLGRTSGRPRRFMLHDVDEPAQWISDIEPTNAPRLTDGTVLNGNAGDFHSSKRLHKVVHFY